MGSSRRNNHGRAGLSPTPLLKSNRGDHYVAPDKMPHTLSIPALIGHKTFDTLDPGFYAMKGNDAVWYGVIIEEKDHFPVLLPVLRE
jgi:hypothetical protein